MALNETLEPLTPFEHEILVHVIDRIQDPARKQALMRQFEALLVRKREYTGCGFYTWFFCPPELRSDDLPDAAGLDTPQMTLWHPTETETLGFILYTQGGALDLLEAVSDISTWPEEDAAAGRWSEHGPKIVFDPTLIDRPPGPVQPLRTLTAFEREALGQVIAHVKDPAKREAMARQVDVLEARGTDSTCLSFFSTFWCPEEHRSSLLQEDFYPTIRLLHPSRSETLLVYLHAYHGAIWRLTVHCEEVHEWPQAEMDALCWPHTRDPIVFDPAYIRAEPDGS